MSEPDDGSTDAPNDVAVEPDQPTAADTHDMDEDGEAFASPEGATADAREPYPEAEQQESDEPAQASGTSDPLDSEMAVSQQRPPLEEGIAESSPEPREDVGLSAVAEGAPDASSMSEVPDQPESSHHVPESGGDAAEATLPEDGGDDLAQAELPADVSKSAQATPSEGRGDQPQGGAGLAYEAAPTEGGGDSGEAVAPIGDGESATQLEDAGSLVEAAQPEDGGNAAEVAQPQGGGNPAEMAQPADGGSSAEVAQPEGGGISSEAGSPEDGGESAETASPAFGGAPAEGPRDDERAGAGATASSDGSTGYGTALPFVSDATGAASDDADPAAGAVAGSDSPKPTPALAPQVESGGEEARPASRALVPMAGRPAPPGQLPASVAPLLAVLGLDTHRHNNVMLVDDDTLVTCIAAHVVFVSLSSGQCRYLRGLDDGGVGAVAVHPSRSLIAVGEKARGPTSPCVYIYSYPELECVKVLRDGTERAYSALSFDASGDTLASVGSFPDFLLTLWDWKTESIVLRAKAFSQDVYTVAFSPCFEGQLTTSGQGHIRFWRMASTFTGLKLQGAIGKFGNVELSDVAAFAELPDGKVLSSTEAGNLLLWDGGLIKVVLTRPDGRPCHNGPVEVLLHDRASSVILSAGGDGFVRLWDFNQVNDAEPREDSHSLDLQPLDEVAVAPGAHIVSLLWEGRRWVVVDRSGAVYNVALPSSGSISKGAVVTRVAAFSAGAVNGFALSPRAHVALSASRDGQLRVIDYRTGKALAQASLPQPITAFAAVPGSGAAVAVTGHRDGVLRVHRRCSAAGGEGDSERGTALLLAGVAKPHKGAVSAIAITTDAARLASCGEDGTVFFFDLRLEAPQPAAGASGVLYPHAYIRLADGSGAATCATWSPGNDTLLVGTNGGTILQVPVPPGDIDTHHSFEWAGAASHVQTYTFCAPKPKRLKKKKRGKKADGDTEGDGADGDDADGKADDADGEAAVEGDDGGEGDKGQDGEEGEAKAEGDEEEDGDADKGDGSEAPAASRGELLTLAVAPDDAEGGSLLVTVGGSGYAARKVWRVRLHEPLAAPLLEGFATAPVSAFAFSADGRLALLGSVDGLLRAQPLDRPYGAALGPYWESPLHDMQSGRVTAAALSFDGDYLLTAGHDGAIHLLANRLAGEVAPSEGVSEELPLVESLPPPPADIASPSAYTLEEEKQQAERDQQIREAEEKKLSVRERLARIRTEFEALLAENGSQPEALQLPRSEFEVDPGLRAMMEAEALRREEVARLELAWESERQRLGLAKLRAYFLDGVETERVVLHSLRGGSYVTTFRTAKLPEETKRELAAIRAAAATAGAAGRDNAGRDSVSGDMRKSGDYGMGGPGGDAAARARLAEATAALEEGAASGRLNKADLRRLARKRREAEWAAFNATRPDDTYDSPADIRAIEEAQRTIGDFKLKSDPNFVVAEEERMTPQRKRAAMLELEEALYNIKRAFNAKLFALRDVKRKVLADMRAKLAALAELSAQAQAGAQPSSSAAHGEEGAAAFLGPFASLPTGLLPEEAPEEAREAVSDADLAAFAARKEEEGRKAAAAAAGGLGGFATTGGGAKRPAGAAGPAAAGGGAAGSGAGAAHGGAGGGGGGGLSASEEALAKMMAAAPPSELEKALAAYNRRRVEHLRAKLTDEINGLIEAFDDAHAALKAERLGLAADVKAGEMRLLVGWQELQLLREFDKRESVLLAKRQAKLDDKQEIVDKISDCADKLEAKRLELEALIGRRAAVVGELEGVVPESDPFREALLRVFHRRIKRSKKKAGGGEDDYDSDEDDDEDEMGDDDGDEDDDGEEVCPPGCDQSVYERVCDLREKRLDEEDMIAEFQKTIEVLRKEKEALAKKQRLVEQGLAAVNADMAEFQKEKQGRLNQVEVVVSLRMHQIEYLLDGCLPDDLSACLVFSAQQLGRLASRVGELEGEKAALRAAHRELRKQHVALLRDKADKEKKVAELEARAHDVQMLKFGQVIDLELLDKVSSSRGTEDLKEELRKQELQYARELAEWDARIAARTDELVALTRENTACLNAVSELTAAQRKLEGGLTATRKGLFTDPVQQRKAEVEERDALVQLVNAQAAELEQLKGQLAALRRKDTSMYG